MGHHKKRELNNSPNSTTVSLPKKLEKPMTHYIRVAALFLLPFLAACEEQIASLCSKSGGECCAISYTSDADGNAKQSIYTCAKSAKACIDLAKPDGGTPSYPYKPSISSERGQCEMEIETVWIWDLLSMKTALANIVTGELLKTPKSFKSRSGKTYSQDHPEYCRYLCEETNDLGLCPGVPVPNDLSFGLLATTIDLAENPTSETRIITIAELLENFRLSPEANKCARNDIIASRTTIQNTGAQQCTTTIRPTTEIGDVSGRLSLPQYLTAKPISTSRIANFDSTMNSITLVVDNESLKNLFNGPITSTGRYQHDKIFAQIRAKNQTSCARIIPEINYRFDIHQISASLVKSQKTIDQSMMALKNYKEKVDNELRRKKIKPSNASTRPPSLFPFTELLNQSEILAKRHNLPPFNNKIFNSGGQTTVSARDAIRLVDISLCSDQLKGQSLNSLKQLIPQLDIENINQQTLKERHLTAGDLIQCKLSAEAIPSTLKSSLRKFYTSDQ